MQSAQSRDFKSYSSSLDTVYVAQCGLPWADKIVKIARCVANLRETKTCIKDDKSGLCVVFSP